MSPLFRLRSFVGLSKAVVHPLIRLLLPALTASLGVWLLMRALTPVAAAQPALTFRAGSGPPFSSAERALFQAAASQAATAQAVGDDLFTLIWSSAEAPDASSVAWGDYDGDGDLDLLAANGPNGLQLYRNDEGSLTPNPVWESDGVRLFISAAWGDYDGDGDLDLAAGGWADQSFSINSEVYRNDNGSFAPAWTDPLTYSVTSVAWGDVDGDGDLDLAMGVGFHLRCTSCPVAPNRLYRNDGGNFTLMWSSAEADDTQSVAWGDVDGDGDLDLAAGNSSDQYDPTCACYPSSIRIYRNDGGALTAGAAWSYTANDPVYTVAWGDMDGDSDLDLAAGISGNRALLYRNDGGTLTASVIETPLANIDTAYLAWGDYDGDADPDLIMGGDIAGIGGGDSSPLQLYRNDAGTLTTSAVWKLDSDDTVISLAWGDYDDDGDLDLAVGNLGEPIRLYRNESEPFASRQAWELEGIYSRLRPHDLAWGDVDGDGDLDLAVGGWGYDAGCNCSRGQVLLHRNDGGQLAATPVWTSTEINLTESVAWGDYDGDGDLDLAVGNGGERIYDESCSCFPGAPNRIYRNDGGTLMASAAWSSAEQTVTTKIAWGDYDSDGDLDLAVTNYADSPQLYRNESGTPDPVFTLVWQGVWQGYYYLGLGLGLGWADYDGDGDLDLATAKAIYRNDSGVMAERPVWVDGGYEQTNSMAWGDYDNDGDPDLALGNKGQNRLYRNDRGTLTTNAVWISTEADDTRSIAWADYDGDGDLDLLAGNFLQSSRVYRNDDGSLTTSAVWSAPSRDLTTSAAWGDYDGDGDPDIAIGNDDFVNPFCQCYTLSPLQLYPNPRDGRSRLGSTPAIQVARPGPQANFYAVPQILAGSSIPITYSLADPQDDPVRSIRAYYSTDGGGQWYTATAAMPAPVIPPGPLPHTIFLPLVSRGGAAGIGLGAHVFYWDPIASGFLGQSDNVVFRIEAIPAIVNQPNTTPGPYLYGRHAAYSFPFRVRGSQVRVMNSNAPAANALVYRLAPGQSLGAEPFADGAGRPFRTDALGYLQGRGQLNVGDRLVALAPITATNTYTVYYTNAAPTLAGLEAYTVTTGGVQTLTVSAANTLILFNLTVSLEWDARNDPQFLSQLEFDLRRASDFLFDWTNGQAALGRINVYQNKEHWDDAQVRLFATNSLRPNAVIGGIVTQTISETNVVSGVTNTMDYVPGQVSMPVEWNRFGQAGGTVGEDWPRTLAHELSHYLFFLDDAYLGLDANGRLIALDTCTGTAMADPYRADYSEFKSANQWSPECDNTLAARSTGRPEWSTLTRFYPLIATSNAGPNGLPLNVTQVTVVNPVTPTTTLNAPLFYLTQGGGRVTPGPEARVILYQGNRLIDLGRPTEDQVLARGTSLGDRLCVYELSAERLGCETMTAGDIELALTAHSGWRPDVIITPVTSRTINVSVSNAPAGQTFQARVYPSEGVPSAIMTLSSAISGTYTGIFSLSDPALAGYVAAWVEEAEPRREVIADYSLGGNPAPPRRSKRKGGAPTTSPDGQLTLYGELDFSLGEFYAIQTVTRLPDLPPWATLVGKGYRLLKSAGAPDFAGASLNLSYFASDVPPGEENFLRLYYHDGAVWQALPTQVDRAHGGVIAPVQGAGLYALLSSVPIPLSGPGWNQFTYPVQGAQPVTQALVSASGYYTTVYGTILTDTQDPWKVYDVTTPDWVNDLTHLEYAKTYWINVSQSITLQVTGGGPQAPLAALPSPPATFYGAVQAGGGFTPAPEMVVTAWIGGNACGQGKTLLVSGQVMYTINVLPEGTGGVAGCGAAGRTITFKVGAQTMTTTAAWDIDAVHGLALTP